MPNNTMKKESYVGLLKELCPVCGKEVDSQILIDRRLKNSFPNAPMEGVGNEPCKLCKSQLNTHVAFIECDESRSKVASNDRIKSPEDACRTGRVFFMRDDMVSYMFNGFDPAKQRIVYCNQETGDILMQIQEHVENDGGPFYVKDGKVVAAEDGSDDDSHEPVDS